MNEFKLDYKKVSTAYLERILSESKDKMKSVTDSETTLRNRVSDLIKYFTVGIVGTIAYIINPNTSTYFANFTFIVLIVQLVAIWKSIELWWIYDRSTNGTFPSQIEHEYFQANEEIQEEKYKYLLYTIIYDYNRNLNKNVERDKIYAKKYNELIIQILISFGISLTYLCLLWVCQHQISVQ